MRILLDYRPALRARTGVGEWVHQLAASLLALKAQGDPAARDLDLTIWTASWRDQPAPSACAELGGARVVDRRLPVRPLVWAWNRVGYPPVEWVSPGPFDVVHSASPLLIPHRQGLGVCTIYDLDFLRHPERAWGEMRRDYPGLVGRHARRADLVVTISEYSRRQIVELLGVPPECLVVCRPGVPSWASAPGPSGRPGPGYILFVGTLEPRKNVGGLLEAYRQLVARRPSIPSLVLAGGAPPAAAAWLAEASSPPLQGRVDVRGYVPDDRRISLYAGAAVVVLPSFDEGFGLPALEAMALGIPVVVSSSGALPEVVGTAGLLIDPADPAALAAAIARVLDEPGLADRLRADGLIRARQFDWLASARALLAGYDAARRRVASARRQPRGFEA